MSGITEKMIQDLPYHILCKTFQKVYALNASKWDSVEFGSQIMPSELQNMLEPYGVFSDIHTAVQRAVQRMPFDQVIFNLDLYYKDSSVAFPFKIHCMRSDDKDLVIVGVVINDLIISMYTLKSDGSLATCFNNKDFTKKQHYKYAKHFFERTAQLLVGIILYLAEYRTNPVMVSASEVKQRVRQEKPKKKNKKRNKVTLTRTRYVVNPNQTKEPEKEKVAITRHTESWRVKGHPRKLKSGKEIYIQPYVKGKGKIVPKTYIVQKEEQS